LWKQMDEKLEDKAKSHNLSAVNVKTILHVSYTIICTNTLYESVRSVADPLIDSQRKPE
uniref:Carboxymuconolactone decarboxylase family protein n=1 Tax=Anisakis simplex TaxID=6269 RepID=A0A0M3K0H9_ANISI